jgi:hypothetical protein
MDNDCVLDAAGGGTAHPVAEKQVTKLRRRTTDILKIL